MKSYGDIPKDHVNLVEELVQLENWFYENGAEISPISAAKGFTCIAHDYFSMHMEEEGSRLLNLAEKQYPGYFGSAIHIHVEKDKDFEQLVKNLKNSLAIDVLISLGFNA
jgi:hypothetical protein